MSITTASGTAHFSVSSTGSLVYIPGPPVASVDQRHIALFDRKGGVQPLKLPPGAYEEPRISPDGKRVAFRTDDGKEATLWTYDLSGTSAARRLTVGGNNRFALWSADGERVAFQSDREGDLGIFWQRADGTGGAERLTRPDQGTSHVPESWSPVGDRFLFRVTKNQNITLWTFSWKDKKAEPFGGVQSTNPTGAVFSPDGRWVAYYSNETGELNKAIEALELCKQTYPRDAGARNNLGIEYFSIGQYEKAAEEFREALRLNPSSLNRRANLIYNVAVLIGPDGKIVGMIPATSSDQTKASIPAVPQIHVVVNWLEELKRLVPTK